VSDRDLVAAATARMRGPMILCSTPWPAQTLMGELVERNFGAPRDALVAVGPSILLRPDDENLRERIAIERERDPETAAREFECVVTAGGGSFFDVADLSASVVEAMPAREPGSPCVAAVDIAFVRDASALCILERRQSGQLAVVHLDQVRPHRSQPIVPSLLINRFAQALRAFGCRHVFSDSFAAEPIREELRKYNIQLQVVTETRESKATRYMVCRSLLADRALLLPSDPKFLAEMRSIVATPKPGGEISISAPRRSGSGHADRCSALVLACHAAKRHVFSFYQDLPRRFVLGTRRM
jgi:phage FluMu gp28-like protein